MLDRDCGYTLLFDEGRSLVQTTHGSETECQLQQITLNAAKQYSKSTFLRVVALLTNRGWHGMAMKKTKEMWLC